MTTNKRLQGCSVACAGPTLPQRSGDMRAGHAGLGDQKEAIGGQEDEEVQGAERGLLKGHQARPAVKRTCEQGGPHDLERRVAEGGPGEVPRIPPEPGR